MNRLLTRIFPELSRFPTPDDAKKAYRRAVRQNLANWRYWLTALSLATMYVIGLVLVQLFLVTHVARDIFFLLSLVMNCFLSPLFGLAMAWLPKRQMQRSLRQELAKTGSPVCIECGYNLTGNVSGVCPECGERI